MGVIFRRHTNPVIFILALALRNNDNSESPSFPAFFFPSICRVRSFLCVAGKPNCECRMKTESVCSSVNIARELSYAPDAALPIWPHLHPYLLLSSHPLLSCSLSLFHTLALRAQERRRRVCIPVCIFLDAEAFSTPLTVAYDN